MKSLLKLIAVLVIFVAATSVNAFRLYTAVSWDITKEQPTLWVQFEDRYFDIRFTENEWLTEGLDNPLQGIPEESQVTEIIRLVFNDINNVQGAYVRLAFVPDATKTLPAIENEEQDTPYDETISFKRKIRILTSASDGVTAGVTRPVLDEADEFNCEIEISSIKSPRAFKTTLTHELGHCLGLGHAHEDRNAIMGYNTPEQIHTLGVDDRMGIIYLYPSEEEFGREVATLGLACDTK